MSGLLSYCEGELGIPLEFLQGIQSSSQVVSGFFSGCDGHLGEPLKLQKRSQASFLVAWGSYGLLLSRCGAIGPFSQISAETQGSSIVVAGNLGFP